MNHLAFTFLSAERHRTLAGIHFSWNSRLAEDGERT